MIGRLVVSGLLTVVVKVGAASIGYSIDWWLAAVVSLVLVFGGCLIVVDGSWD